MITLDIGKDRRSAGEKGVILGNCKTLTIGQSQKLKDDQADDIPW
jgi:hypothetical protein